MNELHRLACEQGEDTYIDAVSGYQVLTSQAHLRRGSCCGNSCRHCPFGHVNVNKPKDLKSSIQTPVLMNWSDQAGDLDVLFWSGGKNSLLTLAHLIEAQSNVVLVTSYGALTHRVSIQNIDIQLIKMQANFFKQPLCLVPLFPQTDYQQSMQAALDLVVQQTGRAIKRIVFGDLHLKDIRQWRVDTWPQYEVYTPLFGVPYSTLLSRLWALQAKLGLTITLSTEVTLGPQTLRVGTPYDAVLVNELERHGIDAMLENGEGHTLVLPPHGQIGCN
jgi:diphthamide synthase (EF-2-diphthine--ammonia ligase)